MQIVSEPEVRKMEAPLDTTGHLNEFLKENN